MRKDPLENGYLYHICTKSIAGFVIFRSAEDYLRMKEMIKYYAYEKPPILIVWARSSYLNIQYRAQF